MAAATAIKEFLNGLTFISSSLKGLGAGTLLGGLPRGRVGGVYAGDAPNALQRRKS